MLRLLDDAPAPFLQSNQIKSMHPPMTLPFPCSFAQGITGYPGHIFAVVSRASGLYMAKCDGFGHVYFRWNGSRHRWYLLVFLDEKFTVKNNKRNMINLIVDGTVRCLSEAGLTHR
jgi:hypothetical protein